MSVFYPDWIFTHDLSVFEFFTYNKFFVRRTAGVCWKQVFKINLWSQTTYDVASIASARGSGEMTFSLPSLSPVSTF
jgi:hypothetical protein